MLNEASLSPVEFDWNYTPLLMVITSLLAFFKIAPTIHCLPSYGNLRHQVDLYNASALNLHLIYPHLILKWVAFLVLAFKVAFRESERFIE